MFSRNLIIVNSTQIAIELFEKRSSVYSERPLRSMAQLWVSDNSMACSH